MYEYILDGIRDFLYQEFIPYDEYYEIKDFKRRTLTNEKGIFVNILRFRLARGGYSIDSVAKTKTTNFVFSTDFDLHDFRDEGSRVMNLLLNSKMTEVIDDNPLTDSLHFFKNFNTVFINVNKTFEINAKDDIVQEVTYVQ